MLYNGISVCLSRRNGTSCRLLPLVSVVAARFASSCLESTSTIESTRIIEQPQFHRIASDRQNSSAATAIAAAIVAAQRVAIALNRD